MTTTLTKTNRLSLFMKGWKRGANAAVKDELYAEMPDYQQGYEAGTVMRLQATEKARIAYGVTSEEMANAVLR